MYKIYWTDKNSGLHSGMSVLVLKEALAICNDQRKLGHSFVTMVSDYNNMVGQPGATGPDSNYVPQMLN